MRFFVAGARGMLASDLVPVLKKKGEVVGEDQPEIDITDISCVRERLKQAMPDIVINCAAYTAVDRAEEDIETAFEVNGLGAEKLAIVCKEVGARLVHISTDFVFDGNQNIPYREEDLTNPLSVYGQSKLEGEELTRKYLDNSLIVRTSWLYGKGGNNFVKTILRLASEMEEVGMVYDQTGTPTYTKDLAEGIARLIDVGATGTYHFSNEGVCSWYDFAHEIMYIAMEEGASFRLKKLRPILTEEYPVPAKRPKYSVLNKGKYKKETSRDIAHWRDALKRYMAETD